MTDPVVARMAKAAKDQTGNDVILVTINRYGIATVMYAQVRQEEEALKEVSRGIIELVPKILARHEQTSMLDKLEES